MSTTNKEANQPEGLNGEIRLPNLYEKHKMQFKIPDRVFYYMAERSNGIIFRLDFPISMQLDLEANEYSGQQNYLTQSELDILNNLTPNQSINLIAELSFFWNYRYELGNYSEFKIDELPIFTDADSFEDVKLIPYCGSKLEVEEISITNRAWFFLLTLAHNDIDSFFFSALTFYMDALDLFNELKGSEELNKRANHIWKRFDPNWAEGNVNWFESIPEDDISNLVMLEDNQVFNLLKNILLFKEFSFSINIDMDGFIRDFKLEELLSNPEER